MPARLTNKTATSGLLELGYKALEDYPGDIHASWRAKHLGCGLEVTLTWTKARAEGQAGIIECPCTSEARAERTVQGAANRKSRNEAGAVERMEAAGWEPLEAYPGSDSEWRCRCMDCGVEGRPKLHGVGKAKGCRSCSGRRHITKESTEDVMLNAEWRPTVPFPGPRSPWPCVCVKCGHESSPRYETTRSGKSGCRKCAGQANGLARRQKFEPTAVAAMQAMQLQPLEPFPGSHKKWLCQCLRCDSLVRPSYANVSSGGRGCEACRRRAQGVAKKATYAAAAEAKLRAAGFNPVGAYPGMERPWPCICRCGRETAVWVSQTVEGDRGCRWCAEYGFKMAVPGVTYLLVNERLGAIKIGVTAVGSTRLRNLGRGGWEAVLVENFETGFEAVTVEKEILDWWREDLRLPAYLSSADMTYGGATETAELEAMPVYLAQERLRSAAVRVRGCRLSSSIPGDLQPAQR